MHKSISTIDSPEFVNLQSSDISPFVSKCDIKVLYIGENRNHTFIDEDTARKMATTLRGSPIVGYYKDEDFQEHSERIVIEDGTFQVQCLTVPYGFVAPDAKIWFQDFEDYDDFGNTVTHKYLMTTGYLWTEQFKECQAVIDEGRPQSMELDDKTLEGHWAKNNKTGVDFFIINDATFSKLCILGDDVEPCFEGANITAPEASTRFSLDNNFKTTLFNMMEELRNYTLKGGLQMEENKVMSTEEVTETEDNVSVEYTVTEDNAEIDSSNEEVTNSYKKDDTSDKESETDKDSDDETDEASTEEEDEDEKKKTKATCKEDDDDKKTKHSLEQDYATLNQQYTQLQAEFDALKKTCEEACEELKTFKLAVDNQKKDELINSFSMLTDEDKKDVIENKAQYSYDDIEAKLAVICVRKKVNFSAQEEVTQEKEEPITTYNMQNNDIAVPEWISALKNARQNNI